MPRSLTHRNVAMLSLACLALWCGPRACAESDAADASPSVDLALKQSQLADKYRGLETKILKIAEYDASANPRRSALLKQTLAKGKQRQIAPQLDDLVRLLREEQLQKAVDDQGAVCADLYALLELLLSENRPDRLKSEQSRVRDYIKQLDRIIRQQKSVQGRTEGGELGERLAHDQEHVADRTRSLGTEIDQAEGASQAGSPTGDQDSSSGSSSGESSDQSGQPSDGSSGDAADPPRTTEDDSSGDENQEGNNGENENSTEESEEQADTDSKDGQTAESSSSDQQGQGAQPSSGEQQDSSGPSPPGQSQPSPSSPSQPGQPGQPGQSQPGQSQPGAPSQGPSGPPPPGQPQQEQQFPGRKRIAAAEDRMRQAREQLEKAQREEAIEQQEEAQQLLEQAKAELEEILRQLREEEIERVLAMLEGRFRRMLEMELRVQAETMRLHKTPTTQRTRQFSIQVGKLSLDQRKIVLEVDKALTLLREEGSSVAFPEAVEQLRADMESVADLLVEEKVGAMTQTIEADIISGLEEMIAALQQAQQDAEQRRNQSPPPPSGMVDPADQPLVDNIAELKMIRALQMRVNTRTTLFANMLADADDPVGQATDEDLVQALRGLSARQHRIHKITSDKVLGKNK